MKDDEAEFMSNNVFFFIKSDLDAHYTSICFQSISVGGHFPCVESFFTAWPHERAEKPKEVLAYTPFQ